MFALTKWTLCCALLGTALSASIEDEKPLVESGDVDDFPLESPWAVAYHDDKTYFSNFGAPFDSVDWVGVVDNGRPEKLYSLADDVDEDVEIMHVKHIAVDTDTGDVFLASYGGPAASHILKCDRECESIRDLGEDFMPTAIAYSTNLKRLFYTLADGNLEESKIVSIKTDGSDATDYAEQSSDTGLAFPVGLAIDDINGHIYWSNDAGPDQIQRGPLVVKASDKEDTDPIGTVMTGKSSFHPHNLAVDPVGQFIYFTDQTSSTHQIGRVDYNGENAERLLNLDESIPHGLALNVEDKTIYWAQTGTSTVMSGEIEDLGVKSSAASTAVALFAVIGALLALVM